MGGGRVDGGGVWGDGWSGGDGWGDGWCGVGGWVGGWVVGVSGWEARGRLFLPIGLFGVAMSPTNAYHRPIDKPGGPKRCCTNTGVNIRSISPI